MENDPAGGRRATARSSCVSVMPHDSCRLRPCSAHVHMLQRGAFRRVPVEGQLLSKIVRNIACQSLMARGLSGGGPLSRYPAVFTADARLLLVPAGRSLRAYSTQTSGLVLELSGHTKDVICAATIPGEPSHVRGCTLFFYAAVLWFCALYSHISYHEYLGE